MFYSLPSKWKHILASTTNAWITQHLKRDWFSNIDEFDKLMSLNSKAIYSRERNALPLFPVQHKRNGTKSFLNVIFFGKSYIIPSQYTLDTKLREFRYLKLLYVQNSNYELQPIYKTIQDVSYKFPTLLCSFCTNDESLQHLFVQYPVCIKILWTSSKLEFYLHVDGVILFGIPAVGLIERNSVFKTDYKLSIMLKKLKTIIWPFPRLTKINAFWLYVHMEWWFFQTTWLLLNKN